MIKAGKMTEEEMQKLIYGDYENNEEVDDACIKRIERFCREHGDDGERASELLEIVRDLISA